MECRFPAIKAPDDDRLSGRWTLFWSNAYLLPDEKALHAAVAYGLNQKNALAIHSHVDSDEVA